MSLLSKFHLPVFHRIDPLWFGRNLFLVLHRILLLGLLALALPLHAQNEPVHMTPEFALTFPLTQNGPDVTVKYPVLINPTTIIKPGNVMRVMYILRSGNADGSTDLVLAHKGNLEQSYSRTSAASDGKSKLPPEIAHEIEGYRRTVWEVSNNFVLAMAQLPTDQMHLIFSPDGQAINLIDERFSFFDGLMVGLPDGKVTALAVENGSYADKAGIKAGDEIISIGGLPAQNDLGTFAKAYAATKKAAHENESSSYPMEVRTPGKEARAVKVSLPPSLKGGLMQGF